MSPLLAFGFGTQEMVILLIICVLIFGRKLPEVGRYLGKGIVEFKKGLKGLEDDLDMSTPARHEPAALEAPRPPQRVTAAPPKFEDNAGGSITTPPQV